MKKIIKFIIFFFLTVTLFNFLELWQDRQVLEDNVIRLHVVANSDSDVDQKVKLQVKDEIVQYLQPIIEQFPNKYEAMEYIRNNISTLQELSNDVLIKLGVKSKVSASLQVEEFDTRVYDTFSLPAGSYDALRIEIGDADGENWWCVVFPSLCLPATGSDFQEVAVSSGFSQKLTNTLSNNRVCRVRFFLLDCVGKLENLYRKNGQQNSTCWR